MILFVWIQSNCNWCALCMCNAICGVWFFLQVYVGECAKSTLSNSNRYRNVCIAHSVRSYVFGISHKLVANGNYVCWLAGWLDMWPLMDWHFDFIVAILFNLDRHHHVAFSELPFCSNIVFVLSNRTIYNVTLVWSKLNRVHIAIYTSDLFSGCSKYS